MTSRHLIVFNCILKNHILMWSLSVSNTISLMLLTISIFVLILLAGDFLAGTDIWKMMPSAYGSMTFCLKSFCLQLSPPMQIQIQTREFVLYVSYLDSLILDTTKLKVRWPIYYLLILFGRSYDDCKCYSCTQDVLTPNDREQNSNRT